jgi:hypothetical protein
MREMLVPYRSHSQNCTTALQFVVTLTLSRTLLLEFQQYERMNALPIGGTTTASVFRTLAQSRRSCRRFQPNRTIPQHVVRDILETTLVRMCGCLCAGVIHRLNLSNDRLWIHTCCIDGWYR